MALINRPLTEDEARNTSYGAARASLWDQLVRLCNEPTPHTVQYEPVREKPVYVPPTQFYCRTIFRSPSDCTWIVPGTLERKL